MDDAESLKPFAGLGGEHRRAVVCEKRARQASFLDGLRETVRERVGGLFEVPLEMAAETGTVIENPERLRPFPLARGGEHCARALVKIEVPESVHVLDLVGPRLARRVRIVSVAVSPLLFRAQKSMVLHVAAHRCVARHRREGRILARGGDEIVVVELEAPSHVRAVLAHDRIGERGGDARMRACVARDLAGEGREGIGVGAGRVEPPLDCLKRKADALAGGGMSPRRGGEHFDAGLELTVVGRSCEERTDDHKTQACPSHADRRVVVVGHAPPRAREDVSRRLEKPYATRVT